MYTCFVLVSSQLSDYNLMFISWTREEENGISVKKMFWCCVSGYKGRKLEKKKYLYDMPPHPNEVIEMVFAHNRIMNKDFISYLIS